MSQDKMTPHDELMALAGKWDGENGDYPESKQQCAADLRALLDSDAFRAMVRNDARYRWLRQHGKPAAEGLVLRSPDNWDAAIDAAASGAGE